MNERINSSGRKFLRADFRGLYNWPIGQLSMAIVTTHRVPQTKAHMVNVSQSDFSLQWVERCIPV